MITHVLTPAGKRTGNYTFDNGKGQVCVVPASAAAMFSPPSAPDPPLPKLLVGVSPMTAPVDSDFIKTWRDSIYKDVMCPKCFQTHGDQTNPVPLGKRFCPNPKCHAKLEVYE